MARRVGEFAEAASLARAGIALYPDDPHFYHGSLLAEYCLLIDTNGEHRKISSVNRMLEDAERAFHRYPEFIRQHYPENWQTEIIPRIEDSFNNNISYLLTEKAMLLRQIGQTGESLECLSRSRQRLGALGKDKRPFREKLPEYCDTAAYLAYRESFYPEKFDVKKRSLPPSTTSTTRCSWQAKKTCAWVMKRKRRRSRTEDNCCPGVNRTNKFRVF